MNDTSNTDQPDVNDLSQVDDHYAEHLAEMNESQDVISSEDIVNEQGTLLCKKGMTINKKTAETLIQHKLTKPIEDSVLLSNSIDSQYLLNKLHGFLQRYPDCGQINDKVGANSFNSDVFLKTPLHPLVIQKLTVINEQMPDEIEKAIFCAWLSLLIAAEMGLSSEEQQQAFLAGLLHDIGFIHLSPEILRKRGVLTPEEWRAIQSHVVIGKLMLEKYDDIPAAVTTAVLEHHERCNGSGYPVNKNDTSLGILGQIVGAADSIYSIRIKQFEKHNRNMCDLLPYLQMNSKTYFYSVYKALASILKRSELSMSLPKDKDISTWASHLLLRDQALNQAIKSLVDKQVLELTEGLKGNKGQSMYKVTQHVLSMTTESGLVREELHDWLQQLVKSPDAAAIAELNEIELMLNELHWQLNYAYNSCNDSLQKTKASADIQFNLREAYNMVGLCLGDLEDKTQSK
jgi:hypothetical protein